MAHSSTDMSSLYFRVELAYSWTNYAGRGNWAWETTEPLALPSPPAPDDRFTLPLVLVYSDGDSLVPDGIFLREARLLVRSRPTSPWVLWRPLCQSCYATSFEVLCGTRRDGVGMKFNEFALLCPREAIGHINEICVWFTDDIVQRTNEGMFKTRTETIGSTTQLLATMD